jgi:hypothetical protein
MRSKSHQKRQVKPARNTPVAAAPGVVLLSRWLVSQGHNRSILAKDLGNVATAIAQPPYEKAGIGWLAQLVARLHVRGKGNEVHSRNLREPIAEDAELALHALGFALREIGWAP